MCAQCHSTNLQKGYVAAADSYATTWSEIDVSCEACHGPASTHVQLAKRRRERREPVARARPASTVALRDTATAAWIIDTATGLAHRSVPRTNRAEIETCGLCHARRGQVWPDSGAGPSPGPDAARRGARRGARTTRTDSSRTRCTSTAPSCRAGCTAAGVTCTDCHDAHRSTTRLTGQCGLRHLPPRLEVRRRDRTPTTRRAAPGRCAPTATCRPGTTWSWTGAATTASRSRAPT